jgi:hypothetical protein
VPKICFPHSRSLRIPARSLLRGQDFPGISGAWAEVACESGKRGASRAPGTVVFRFHARDLHLVLGPAKDGKPVRFRVTLDGTPPGDDRGSDTNVNGNGTVKVHRPYQLPANGSTRGQDSPD